MYSTDIEQLFVESVALVRELNKEENLFITPLLIKTLHNLLHKLSDQELLFLIKEAEKNGDNQLIDSIAIIITHKYIQDDKAETLRSFEQHLLPETYARILKYLNVSRKKVTRATCSVPFSVQELFDLYGPFTMALGIGNGQILDLNVRNITSLNGMQNYTNIDVMIVSLINNCIVGNIVDPDFPDTPFVGVPNTEAIRLAQNNIESLPVTFFSGLDKLSYITLGANKLRSFPEGFFEGHDFSYLGIGKNLLSSLDSIDISGMPSLDSFMLNNNFISSIPADYFQNNPLLNYINLSYNNLTEWPATILNNNPLINYLDLSYNALSDFQPDSLPDYAAVLLTGNFLTSSQQDVIQSLYPTVFFSF
jgi:hypothetical protein